MADMLYTPLWIETVTLSTPKLTTLKIAPRKVDRMYRQGDVLLIPVAALPTGLKAVKRDKGRLVLAYGEATGHTHTVDAPPESATLFTTKDNERFLKLVAPAPLVHEEHDTIPLAPGIYRQIAQEEWTDDMEQPVQRIVD